MSVQVGTVTVLSLAKSDEWKKKGFTGFKLPKGQVVWTGARLDFSKDRKKVRVSRVEWGYEYHRYINPHTQVELVKGR
jgi:hypothetical protein